MGFCFWENRGGRADMAGLTFQSQGEGKQSQRQRRQKNCSPSIQPSHPCTLTHLSWQQHSRASHSPGKLGRVGAPLPAPSSTQQGSHGEPRDDSAMSSSTGASHTANGLPVGECWEPQAVRHSGSVPCTGHTGHRASSHDPQALLVRTSSTQQAQLWSRHGHLTAYRGNITVDLWVTPS